MNKRVIKGILNSNYLGKLILSLYRQWNLKLYSRKLQKPFLRNGYNIFKDFCSTLNKHEIQFWLCYGTLLGYVRENGIIKHDCDFDIGIWYSDYSKELENILILAGYKLIREFKSVSSYEAFEQTYSKDGVQIDIFYHHSDSNKSWSHIFYREEDDDLESGIYRIRKLDYPSAPLEKTLFLGCDVYVFKNKEIYLEEIYGTDWRIPNPKFDWKKGPKNNCTVKGVYGKKTI